jgi:antitoxin component YwqK of YwqJK toxin-antitoxin module
MEPHTKYIRDSNGQIREIASYSKGRRHGITSWFFANGFLERVANFWYDQLHGDYFEFWLNGKRAVKAEYMYGALQESEEYDESGFPVAEEKSDVAGALHRLTK